MLRRASILLAAGLFGTLVPGVASALTRELVELQPAQLTFDRSIVHQLSFGTYRDPFDELQTRPYNLLFTNIGRHPTLTPWPGQEGHYRRYVNALIGNNGATDVDNDADSLQGSLIHHATDSISWGVSGAFLSGTDGSDDSSGTMTFSNADDLAGVDLRGAMAFQLSESNLLGAGLRLTSAASELSSDSFDAGVGGTLQMDEFTESNYTLDVGMRHFSSSVSSWEIRAELGQSSFEKDQFSEDRDDAGAVTDRVVTTNYDVTDLRFGVEGSYNRQKPDGLGETEYRAGLEHTARELDNDDLAFSETLGAVTPVTTLLDQDSITTTGAFLSWRTIFQAGETEMFTGARLGFSATEGSTRIDASSTIVNEEIEDSTGSLSLTLGLRQPVFRDKLRFVVGGSADFVNFDTETRFDVATDGDDGTQTLTRYSIGIEGVLANVNFDLAWLFSEESPAIPTDLGIPGGSRRVIEVDRLVFSAAVSW
ncbi:MAG: hypothetical protein GY716_02930 [bacterium]|nr:hypothetical protein [bacterium]